MRTSRSSRASTPGPRKDWARRSLRCGAGGAKSVYDMQAPWPLIGRSAELERMHWAASNRCALVLAGEPGVGKTRLASQFLAAAEQAGAATARLTGTRSASQIPFRG